MLKKFETLIAIALMLSSILVIPGTSPVHALQTGTICVVPVGSTNCSSAPASFGPTSPGQTLSVAVVIQSSEAFNGFFVTLLADHTILQPTSASLTGTVLTSGSIQEECLQGITKVGSSCPLTDTIDTLSIAVLQSPLVANSTTGLLFTATYTVEGRSAGTTIGFQTGCTGTNTGACVEIEKAGVADPETLVAATFANNIDFTLTATPSTIETAAGVPASISLSVAAIGGFSDTIQFTTAPSTGLTDNGATLTTCSLGTSCAVTLTVSSTANGQYTDVVTATGLFTLDIHQVTVSVTVEPRGFSLSANPNSLTIAPGATSTSVITVTGTSGFSGMVTLSSTPTESFSPSVVTLTPDNTGASSATSTVTISVASGTAGGTTINVAVTGTGGGQTASTTIAVTVGGFSVLLTPSGARALIGQPLSSDITVSGTNGFSGTVTLTLGPVVLLAQAEPANCDPSCVNNIGASLSAKTLNVPAGGLVHSLLTINSNPATTMIGDFAINITFSSPGQTSQIQTFSIVFNDYQIAIPTPSITVDKGPFTGGTTFDSISQTVTVASLGVGLDEFFNFAGATNTTTTPIKALPPTSPAAGLPGACLLPEFYPNGTEIPTSVILAQASSPTPTIPLTMAGPVTGCKDDGGALVIPPIFFGLPAGTPTATITPTTLIFPHTTLGTYRVLVNTFAGTIEHTLSYTVTVINPPTFNQFHWKHRFSFAREGGVETFVAGITNPNTVPINVQVVVTAISGGTLITASSAIVKVGAGATVNNIDVILPVADTHATYLFTAEVTAGVDPAALTAVSTVAAVGIPISGSFTVLLP